MDIIECSSLSKRYGTKRVLDQVSISIKENTITGLIGKNGSGKTTLLNILSGLDKNYNGILKTKSDKKIGLIVDSPVFFNHLTVVDNLRLSCMLFNNCVIVLSDLLKEYDLYDMRNTKFVKLSYGQKQRLSLVSVMINDPDIILFDEPTNGLDPCGIKMIRDIVMTIHKKGKTIILSSHILSEIEAICSDIIYLEKGKVLYDGNMKDVLKRNMKLENIFN